MGCAIVDETCIIKQIITLKFEDDLSSCPILTMLNLI